MKFWATWEWHGSRDDLCELIAKAPFTVWFEDGIAGFFCCSALMETNRASKALFAIDRYFYPVTVVKYKSIVAVSERWLPSSSERFPIPKEGISMRVS